jgi:hypothetical protein
VHSVKISLRCFWGMLELLWNFRRCSIITVEKKGTKVGSRVNAKIWNDLKWLLNTNRKRYLVAFMGKKVRSMHAFDDQTVRFPLHDVLVCGAFLGATAFSCDVV